jgi:hypothetical protein
MLRDHEGVFGAPRGGGKTHTGVDIVANQSTMDKEQYRVTAVADGKVAYAKFNGKDGGTEGYGYTVVIDHQNGTYTLYAHLATIASGNLVKVGDQVNAGKVIGYMADLANGEASSGNVLANSVVSYDKIQLHFEEFQAPAGRTSTDAIATIKKDGTILNPTSDLVTHGYKHGTAQSQAPVQPKNQNEKKKEQTGINLSGLWTASGYVCRVNHPVPSEKIRIVQTTNFIVAKKEIGDDCVLSGEVTFRGNFTGPKIPSTMPVSITVGAYDENGEPTSSRGVISGTLNIVDKNTVYIVTQYWKLFLGR